MAERRLRELEAEQRQLRDAAVAAFGTDDPDELTRRAATLEAQIDAALDRAAALLEETEA